MPNNKQQTKAWKRSYRNTKECVEGFFLFGHFCLPKSKNTRGKSFFLLRMEFEKEERVQSREVLGESEVAPHIQ
jgi:hypothetical protein